MRLKTKDGWLLTDFTTEKLIQQFDGTLDELQIYIRTRKIEQEPVNDIVMNDQIYVKPVRYFIGDLDLYSNQDGIIGTSE